MKKLLTAAALVALALSLTGCFSVTATYEDEPAPPSSATPEPTTVPEVTEEQETSEPEESLAPATDADKSATLDSAIKDALGVAESYQELLVVDPTLWGGYIADVRMEGTRAYVTLQVDGGTPDGRELGERAAQALSTLLTQETVDTLEISWVIVEDGAGIVIDQKQPNPLI